MNRHLTVRHCHEPVDHSVRHLQPQMWLLRQSVSAPHLFGVALVFLAIFGAWRGMSSPLDCLDDITEIQPSHTVSPAACRPCWPLHSRAAVMDALNDAPHQFRDQVGESALTR